MIASLVMYVVMASVFFLMLGVGLGISFREVIDVAKKIQLVAIGLAANFLIVPIAMYLSILWLPISSDVKIGIMLMAAAPIAPMAPPFVGSAKGDVPYSVGLMTIVAVLSVPLTPLILSLALPKSEGGLVLDPFQIIQTLLMVQLIPISIGMAVRQYSLTWTEKLLEFVPNIGRIGLIVGVGLLMAKQAKEILTLGLPAHLVVMLLVIGSLVVGHLMMIRKKADTRRALAVVTAIRNVPLAFLIASENFAGTVVAPVVLLMAAWTMIVAIAYGKVITRMEGQS